MAQKSTPSDESAVAIAAEALWGLEETIQEGDHLFVLDPESPQRRRENETIRVSDNLVYYLTFFLMVIGFTCIMPRQPRVSTRTSSPQKPGKFARIRSIRRLQSKHEKSVQSQQHLQTNRWRVAFIYLGPLMFFIGPNLVTIGTAALHGPAKAALVAIGAVISALPLYSTLLKKGRILNFKRDLENATEDAIRHNIQAADELGFMTAWNWVGYLVADVANVVIGSWAAFSHDTAYGVGNAVPDIVGLCIVLPLCIFEANAIGSKEFQHDLDGSSGRFIEFVSDVETTKNSRRAEAQESVTQKSRASNVFILLYALISLIIHIVLILSNPRSRSDVTYVTDLAISVIINFITATYLMARLMQQVYPNYFLAHVRAEWGAHLWRRELETKLRDAFDKVHMLEDTIKDVNIQIHVLELEQRLRAVREQMWYIKLVRQFPTDMRASGDEMNIVTESERNDTQTTFTALREKLRAVSTEYADRSTNHGLRLHHVNAPLRLSDLSLGDANQTKMNEVKDHVNLLDGNFASCRTSTKLYLRLTTLGEEVSDLSASVQQYVQRTSMVVPFVTLSASSTREAFLNTLKHLALPPIAADPLYIDHPPTRLQNSMTVQVHVLENCLREISDLEHNIERKMLEALTNSSDPNGRRPNEEGFSNRSNNDDIVTDGTQSIDQLRAVMEQKRMGMIVQVRSWLQQYGQSLGANSEP